MLYGRSSQQAHRLQRGGKGVRREPQDEEAAPPEVTVDEMEREDKETPSARGSGAPASAAPEEEFSAPFNIPFGGKRRAVLYMPSDTTPDEAVYVQNMISLMFQQVYGNRSK